MLNKAKTRFVRLVVAGTLILSLLLPPAVSVANAGGECPGSNSAGNCG
jgi:hypothetical protein